MKSYRSYLKDIHQKQDGSYQYEGNYMAWPKSPGRRTILTKAWILALAGTAAQIAAGWVKGSFVNLIYVLLPYAIGFVGWVSVTYGLARLTLAKDPVREYVHAQTAAKLPGRGILSAVFSGIAVIGTLGAVFFGNTGDNWISYVSFLLPEVAACGISIRIVCIFTELSWVKIVQDSENVRTEGK